MNNKVLDTITKLQLSHCNLVRYCSHNFDMRREAQSTCIWKKREMPRSLRGTPKVRAYGRNEKCLEVYVEHLKRTDHWRDLDIEVKMVLTYHYL